MRAKASAGSSSVFSDLPRTVRMCDALSVSMSSLEYPGRSLSRCAAGILYLLDRPVSRLVIMQGRAAVQPSATI